MELKKLYSAVACAVAVLEGTAGGYSPYEKMQAKLTLMEWQKLMLNPTTGQPTNYGPIIRR